MEFSSWSSRTYNLVGLMAGLHGLNVAPGSRWHQRPYPEASLESSCVVSHILMSHARLSLGGISEFLEEGYQRILSCLHGVLGQVCTCLEYCLHLTQDLEPGKHRFGFIGVLEFYNPWVAVMVTASSLTCFFFSFFYVTLKILGTFMSNYFPEGLTCFNRTFSEWEFLPEMWLGWYNG